MGLSKMRGVRLAIVLFSISYILIAKENIGVIEESLTTSSAYYFPNHRGLNLSGGFAPIEYSVVEADKDTRRNIGSTWGSVELKETYKLSLTTPFITGNSSLTKGNNIKYTGIFSISPVTVEVGGEIALTPIAFLEFKLGGSTSSGWTVIGINGLGLNSVNNKLPDPDPFQGAMSQLWLTGTFKFDLAAILQGDTTWKHIILLSSHTVKYRNFSAAGDNDPWIYQGDNADNFNGLRYHHTSFLGYQMPLVLNMAGLLVETQENISSVADKSTMDSSGWGSDFRRVRFGGLFNLKIDSHSSLTLLPQFSTAIRYVDDSVRELYFENRVTDRNNPTFIYFDRIAIVYTYKF